MKRTLLAFGLLFGIAATADAQLPGGPETKKTGLIEKVFSNGGSKPQYTPEELQLQAYWSNYYRGLANYYASLNNVDWVAYYKANGYPIDPRFYNPYNVAPGTTMVPMQPIAIQNMAQPVMVPPARTGSGVIQVNAIEMVPPTSPKMDKLEKTLPGTTPKSSSRR